MILESAKIAVLKTRLRSAYIEAENLSDGYSCGSALAEYINPNISAAKKRFDEIAAELSKLDPKCPAFRYYSKSSEGGAHAPLART